MNDHAYSDAERAAIYRAIVRNKAQLAYDAVSDWIEGEGELPGPARRVEGTAAVAAYC